MDAKKSIEALHFFATGLTEGALEMIECIGAQNWLYTQV